jgi:hypothetical protein
MSIPKAREAAHTYMLTSVTIHTNFSELGHRDGSNRSLGMVSGTLEIVPKP